VPLSFWRTTGPGQLRVQQLGKSVGVFLSPVLQQRHSKHVIPLALTAQQWPQQVRTRPALTITSHISIQTDLNWYACSQLYLFTLICGHFYRATANAYAWSCYRHLSICPSVCQTRGLWQKEMIACKYMKTVRWSNVSSYILKYRGYSTVIYSQNVTYNWNGNYEEMLFNCLVAMAVGYY